MVWVNRSHGLIRRGFQTEDDMVSYIVFNLSVLAPDAYKDLMNYDPVLQSTRKLMCYFSNREYTDESYQRLQLRVGMWRG